MTIAEGFEKPKIDLQSAELDGEFYFKISNHDRMDPFFMSIVSDSNHWMFISSNGGLTAGRKDANHALFPYYTDDIITESAEITGSKSIFKIKKGSTFYLWEPFSVRQQDSSNRIRNIYKNILGNKIVFEEINHDIGLSFRYHWNSSNLFGFVRKVELSNNTENPISVEILDGIQNIMPYGVPAGIQEIRSNLVDAYKKCELEKDAGLGIYTLSSIIVDRAEPSEALKANIVWSTGIERPEILITSRQLDSFRNGKGIQSEVDEKAKKGAYFLNTTITLKGGEKKSWKIIANVNQGPSDVIDLAERIISEKNLDKHIEDDIELGSINLTKLVCSSDGLQLTSDTRRNTRHYSNTLFNIMRGGIFDHNYAIENWDFEKYLKNANPEVFRRNRKVLSSLPETFSVQNLKNAIENINDVDLERLSLEYLPLMFSRRHGDPSRPWNRFSINTRSEIDGSKILDYEGNWRDIFQNWEALAHSYPEFIEGMILKFLNASTFDGYNPYRVTKGGFDWETIEPHDPWSYIGYWGDHQIIYLLKFLEFIEDYYPGKLFNLFSKELFVYANVPYKIRPYEEILRNPKDTIEFDEELDIEINQNRNTQGADAAILKDQNHRIYHVNFVEKILATTLAKISNFIPEGGIWLNTQRPEWNDANNALVGNGVSMVTLYYLRRFFVFFEETLAKSKNITINISEELSSFFISVEKTLNDNKKMLSGNFSDIEKRKVLDGLGIPASLYREVVYNQSFSGKKVDIDLNVLKDFSVLIVEYLDHAIRANKREDGMYHSYNLMSVNKDQSVSIDYLDEMLEGQVAVLSSGFLSSKESLDLLHSLRNSKLYREDQNSYILYPNKQLPRFLKKNNIPSDRVKSSDLLQKLLNDQNRRIIEQDSKGNYHFNGNFRNADDLKAGLESLPHDLYGSLIEKDRELLLNIFEEVFDHKSFTGRSGTFFGYEGLGSIYWHMVSKLRLAVSENCYWAAASDQDERLIKELTDHYYEITAGIGSHKSPVEYGAFPSDPYSHTPAGKGVQQPGMTGQVKEDILSRIGELGIKVKNGEVTFSPFMLKKHEFLTEGQVFKYFDTNGHPRSLEIDRNSLAFTVCKVPVVYSIDKKNQVRIVFNDSNSIETDDLRIRKEYSSELFLRNGKIDRIEVKILQNQLLN